MGHYGVSNVRSAIAFSFFSIFIWVSSCLVRADPPLVNVPSVQTVCSVLAYRRYQVGSESEFSSLLVPGDSVFGGSGGSGYQSIGGYNQESTESPQYRSQDSKEDLRH